MERSAFQPRLRALGLETHILNDIRAFYEDTIGFPVAAEASRSIEFRAGETRLVFDEVADGTEPYYHVAFNISKNKLDQAKVWLEERVTLLRHAETGEDVIVFPAWNAHALFFYDPAGSLIELIARHTLSTAADGPFGVADILYASEIALRPPDQERAIAVIRETFGLTHYLDGLSFLGDERGLIIVSPQDRLWIPEYRKAGAMFPTRIVLAGHGAARLAFADAPFEIVGVV